ncbi:hypothetical protein AB3S75_045341 [Citrus x aurantiifolia]
MSMNAYFSKMKCLADSLAIAGKPIEHNDPISYILTGLDSQDYESLVTILLARSDTLSLDELYSLLLSHEMRIEQKKRKINADVIHNLSTNIAQKNQNLLRGGSGNSGFPRGNGGFGNFNQGGNNVNHESNIVCQICFIRGHGATKCRNRFNPAFVPQRNFGRGNFRPGFGNYGRGFIPNNFALRPFNGFGRNNTGQYAGSPMGYGFQSGFQGHVTYQNSDVASANSQSFSYNSHNSGSDHPAAFNCFNGTINAS